VEKFPYIFGGHLISMKILLKKEEGLYTYSLRMKGIIPLFMLSSQLGIT
jgi:hypothetical protein